MSIHRDDGGPKPSVRLIPAKLAFGAALGVAVLPAFGQTETTSVTDLALDLGRVFTFFFLTLGPKNVIKPFVRITQDQARGAQVQAALFAMLIALVSVGVAATIGIRVLHSWSISHGALLIAAGIILFLVALDSIRDQYESDAPSRAASAQPPANPRQTAFRIAFPYIVSPYGVAVVILVLTLRPAEVDPMPVYAMLVGIMLLNLLAMLLAHSIAKSDLIAPLLAILSAVLGVLQAAFGVQAVITGLRLVGLC